MLFNADRSKLEIYPAEKEEKGYQIPEGCTEIGCYAFRDVKNLKSIDLTGVVSLEEGAFYGASLSGKLILPDSLTKLEGGFLFENCTAIKQVNAGNHLKKIAARTFTGCDALTEVKLPQSITWADEHAFPDTAKVTCENTELVRFGKNGFHYAEQVSVLGTRDYQMTFQVLSLVNEERKKQGLSPVNMDAGLLQSAMKRAEELSLLFSHTRPDGTSCFSVNQDMVAEARKDTDDEEEKPDSVPAQKNKILRIGGAKYKVTTAAAKKREVRYMKPIKRKKVIRIPASIKVKGIMYKVTSIAPRAFKGNKKVTSVTIAGSIERIGKRAFYNCTNLEKIIIRTKRLKKKRVGVQAFAKLSKKTVIYVPKRKRKAYKKLLKARGAAKAKIK